MFAVHFDRDHMKSLLKALRSKNCARLPSPSSGFRSEGLLALAAACIHELRSSVEILAADGLSERDLKNMNEQLPSNIEVAAVWLSQVVSMIESGVYDVCFEPKFAAVVHGDKNSATVQVVSGGKETLALKARRRA